MTEIDEITEFKELLEISISGKGMKWAQYSRYCELTMNTSLLKLISALEESRNQQNKLTSEVVEAVRARMQEGTFYTFDGLTAWEWRQRADEAEKQVAALKAQESAAEAWRRGWEEGSQQATDWIATGVSEPMTPYTPPLGVVKGIRD